MRSVVGFLRIVAALVGKLAVVTMRVIAYMVWVGCLFWAGSILLRGVAQSEGEGLAKLPETAEQLRGRMILVFSLLAAGLCGWLVLQTIRFLSGGLGMDWRSRLLRTVFEGLVWWAGICLFFCLLILAGSLQARWQVPRAYYWVAGGAGIILVSLLAAAELVHRRLPSSRNSPSRIVNGCGGQPGM
jgi:hypothetical protein